MLTRDEIKVYCNLACDELKQMLLDGRLGLGEHEIDEVLSHINVEEISEEDIDYFMGELNKIIQTTIEKSQVLSIQEFGLMVKQYATPGAAIAEQHRLQEVLETLRSDNKEKDGRIEALRAQSRQRDQQLLETQKEIQLLKKNIRAKDELISDVGNRIGRLKREAESSGDEIIALKAEVAKLIKMLDEHGGRRVKSPRSQKRGFDNYGLFAPTDGEARMDIENKTPPQPKSRQHGIGPKHTSGSKLGK